MRTLFVILVAALTAGPIVAEEVSLRSGDHPTFTRLVLSIGAESGWALNRTASGYALMVDGATTYDSSDVFGRISRDRITGLEPEDGRLHIVTGCDCHADAFLFRPDRLVVDIIDGPPPEGSPFEAVLEDSEPSRAAAQRPESRVAGAILPLLPFDPYLGRSAVAETPAAAPEPRVEPQMIVDPGLTAAIDAAADSGLLERAPDAPPSIEPSQAQPDGSVPGLSSFSGLQADPMRPLAAANTPCPDPAFYDVPSWEDPDASFREEFARLRLAMADDGEASSTNRLALARFHLAHGMGREAAQLLDDTWPESGLMRRMSLLLEGKPDEATAAPGWQACAAAVLLWEAAMRRDLTGLRSDQVADLISAFMLLPPPVAGRIGPALALGLAEQRNAEAADTILARLDASPWADDRELARIEARIDRLSGAPDRAIRQLTELNANGGLDASSFIDLVTMQLESGTEVAPDLLELGEILRREKRGSPTGGHLARVLIMARSATGSHAAALSLLDEARTDLAQVAPDLPSIIREDLMVSIAETGSDALFLELAFRENHELLGPVGRRAFARRLTDMGFGDEAAQHLPQGPSATVNDAFLDDPVSSPGAAPAVLSADTAPPQVQPDFAAVSDLGRPLGNDTGPTSTRTPLRARQIVLEQSGAARLRVQDLLDGTPSPPDLGNDG